MLCIDGGTSNSGIGVRAIPCQVLLGVVGGSEPSSWVCHPLAGGAATLRPATVWLLVSLRSHQHSSGYAGCITRLELGSAYYCHFDDVMMSAGHLNPSPAIFLVMLLF